MADLLLELFSEEIPARMQQPALKQLVSALQNSLQNLRLEHDIVQQFVTPRRIAVIVRGLPMVQPDILIEKKGPKLSANEAAITGFCKSVGVERDQLQIIGDGESAHYVYKQTANGQDVAKILVEAINEVIAAFNWAKSMRWGDGEQSWVRPLRSIICLFDGEILPVEYAGVKAGRETFGHRFMSDGAIEIANADEYQEKLRAAHVIADFEARQQMILQQAKNEAAKHGLHLREDLGLLEEVTGLVEYPVVLCGSFDENYLRLPPEVLVLEMRHHQKYFAMSDGQGKLANRFIITANIEASDGGAAIIAGNQRVLKARLEDGAFYYEQDLKKPLAEMAAGLEVVIFHQKLGTVAQKVERVQKIAEYITLFVPHASVQKVQRAASLCKADLLSGMVGEFPELQGVIGRYYALAQGEDPQVAEAIMQHYMPVGASDDVPNSPVSIVIALADKLDSMCALFSIGEIPSGSRDPYALRRSALGIIRILRTHQLNFPLQNILQKSAKLLVKTQHEADEIASKIYVFMLERLKVALKDEGVRYDIIDAVLSDSQQIDFQHLLAKINILDGFMQTQAGQSVLASYKRAANILKKEEKTTKYDGMFVYKDLQQPQEIALVEAISAAEEELHKLLGDNNFTAAMELIGRISPQLDEFFAHIMVNVEDEDLRKNRLNILAAVRNLMHQIADFSKIEGV